MPEWIDIPLGTVKRSLNAQGELVVTAREGESLINANGAYQRLASGMQICSGRVVLEYFAADILRAFWTFPAPFVSHIRVTFTIETVSNGALFPSLGALRYVPSSVEQADLRVMRVAGGTPFAAGDTVTVNVLAMGFWK